MDYLQYKYDKENDKIILLEGFKPYYKWITFNTSIWVHMSYNFI